MIPGYFGGICHSLHAKFQVPSYSSSMVTAVKPKLKIFSHGHQIVILNSGKKMP
jgi:hypothetical protein